VVGYSGWVISASEHTAVESAELPPLGGSDRWAAHYYRAQHARALQGEECRKQKAQAAERIIVQLQVLIGWLVQQIRDLQRQLAWLRQQQFGRKSESRPNPERSPTQPTGTSSAEGTPPPQTTPGATAWGQRSPAPRAR
jgi:hypothetical protein